MASFNKVLLIGKPDARPRSALHAERHRGYGTRDCCQSHLHRRKRREARRSHLRRRDLLGTHRRKCRRVSKERPARFSSRDVCSSIPGTTNNPVKSATSSRSWRDNAMLGSPAAAAAVADRRKGDEAPARSSRRRSAQCSSAKSPRLPSRTTTRFRSDFVRANPRLTRSLRFGCRHMNSTEACIALNMVADNGAGASAQAARSF